MKDDKYRVFKRRPGGQDDHYYGGDAIEDAVVIRLQDEFAEAGLSAYAMNIQTVLDVVKPNDIGTGTYRRLGEIRDWFMQNAHEAGNIRRDGEAKLPD